MKKKVVKKAAKKTVKRTAKKAVKKKAIPVQKPAAAPVMPPPVGEIIHFYPNISVGVVKVMKEIKQGDAITIAGHGRNFEQKVGSMQVEHQSISLAKKGQVIGMKVAQPVKEKDLVYRK